MDVGKQHAKELSFNTHSRRLYVNCASGLGNRLRAYASAAALAESRNMALHVVWVPDHHFNGNMDDLFDVTSIDVIDFDPVKMLSPSTTLFYDDMKEGRANTIMDKSSDKDIYVRTPFSLSTESKIDYRLFAKHIVGLRPLPEIKELVRRHIAKLPAPIENFVAVHIRHEGNFFADVPKDNEPVMRNGAYEVSRYRKLCNEESFVTAILNRMRTDPTVHFLVATDSPDVLVTLRSIASRNVHMLDYSLSVYCRSGATRDIQCLRFALVELLALSRCGKGLIWSHMSSYSEILKVFFDESNRSNGCYNAE